MKHVYIARTISKNGRKDEVFISYESAKEYIDSLVSSLPNRKDRISFCRYNILEYPLDEGRGYPTREWEFAIDGRLLKEVDYAEAMVSDFDRFDYEQKYSVGDLVLIKVEQIDNFFSFYCGDTYGVVVEKPITKEEWLVSGKSEKDWDGCYIVLYITPTGIANHMHKPEGALKKINAKHVPNTFAFLKEYSDHLKGIRLLPDDLVANLLKDHVYLMKTENYY